MILNHFKIKKEFLRKHKPLLDFSKVTLRGKPIMQEMEIRNRELMPHWSAQNLKLKLPTLDLGNHYASEPCDACLKAEKNRTSQLIDLENPIVLDVFDKITEHLIFERYFMHKRPFFTKMPFSYDVVPVGVRNVIINFLNSNKKMPIFPSWPCEKSVDTLRHVFIKALEMKTGQEVPHADFWPNKKRCCFVATHDMETSTSFRNIQDIREIERRHGFVSSWNVVSNKYRIDFEALRKLRKEGCEIGIHGYNHDGKLPFIGKDAVDKRLEHARNMLKEFECSSFRSPQLQRNEKFLRLLSNYFSCDSSVPDTDIKGAAALKSGCCTVFPFMISNRHNGSGRNMVEMPITMPQDFRMIYSLGLDERKMLRIWKEKADYIYDVGGVINILTHPDDYLTGDERYLRVYEKFLEHMSKKEGIYHDTMSNAAQWWKSR